jgi:hypothetical protein
METPLPLPDELWTQEIGRYLSVTDWRVLIMTSRRLARVIPRAAALSSVPRGMYHHFRQADDDRHTEAILATARFYTAHPVLCVDWERSKWSTHSSDLRWCVAAVATRFIRDPARDPLPDLKALGAASLFTQGNLLMSGVPASILLRAALYANRLDLIHYFCSRYPEYYPGSALESHILARLCPSNPVKCLVFMASRGYVRSARLILRINGFYKPRGLSLFYYILYMAQAAIAHQQYAFLDQLADWFGPLFTQHSSRQRQRMVFLRRDMKGTDPRVEAWFARVFNFRAVAGWTREQHATNVDETLCRFHELPV